MNFTKMHGAGNDYVYIDARNLDEDWPTLCKAISDRHFGIGSDGLILIKDSDIADLRMQMFNADGSEGEMCGNGIRCFAKYAIEHDIVPRPETGLTIDTLAGIRTVVPIYDGNTVTGARVAMGIPRLAPKDIPVSLDPAITQSKGPILKYAIQPGDFRLHLTFVSMGNPHAVAFVEDDVDDIPLHDIGPQIQRHPMFPRRVNFEIVNVLDSSNLKARVWERGSGLTMACGTGACAVAVAARLHGYIGDDATVALPGGELIVRWPGRGEVVLEGPMETVFDSEWAE